MRYQGANGPRKRGILIRDYGPERGSPRWAAEWSRFPQDIQEIMGQLMGIQGARIPGGNRR